MAYGEEVSEDNAQRLIEIPAIGAKPTRTATTFGCAGAELGRRQSFLFEPVKSCIDRACCLAAHAGLDFPEDCAPISGTSKFKDRDQDRLRNVAAPGLG